MASPAQTLIVVLIIFAAPYLSMLSSSDAFPSRDINLENPVLQLTASSVDSSSEGMKDSVSSTCERVRIVGVSRFHFTSYASSIHILVNASDEISERLLKKVKICFHGNTSSELCQCEAEDQKSLKMGQWSALMSPYDTKLIDIQLPEGISRTFEVSVVEEIQHWRLFCLGIGFLLLLLAPIISNWVPFYYSSSMFLGVLLVILLLLFQGMKLLPTGRKNILYLTLYGSVLGMGSLLAHYFSVFVNSVLASLGLSEEMHNPVSVFALMFIILSGAAMGFWMVRKFVLSDGVVDSGIAQFVKWAMRAVAMLFIFQSSRDTVLAVTSFVLCWNICSFINSLNWKKIILRQHSNPTRQNMWQQSVRKANAIHRNVEFLSPSGKTVSRRASFSGQPIAHHQSDSPVKGLILADTQNASPSMKLQDYYSTFHRTPTRKFSKKEWEAFTQESTKNALLEWASRPQVAEWFAENAHRIHLKTKDGSDNDDAESTSGSSSEEVIEDSPSFFRWL